MDIDEVLEIAAAADPTTRIDHRDSLAKFGSAAVGPMAAWLTDERLCVFAVKVLEKLMDNGVPGARDALLHAIGSGNVSPRALRDAREVSFGLAVANGPGSKARLPASTDASSYVAGAVAVRGYYASAQRLDSLQSVLRKHGRPVHPTIAIRMIRDQADVPYCDRHLTDLLVDVGMIRDGLVRPAVSSSKGFFSFVVQSQIGLDLTEARSELHEVLSLAAEIGDPELTSSEDGWRVSGYLKVGATLEAAIGPAADHCTWAGLIGDVSVLSFMRGVADAAGNCRYANRYIDGRVRVRLDLLNTAESWEAPVALCHYLQRDLEVPVQQVTWGHPNMGRGLREHQLNIFNDDFLPIGFRIPHKQRELETYATGTSSEAGCPGVRSARQKLKDAEESSEMLPVSLRGRHFDAYWQICRALGCRWAEHLRGPSLGLVD